MKKIATLLFMSIMLMPATAIAGQGQEVCPSEGKVETGDLNGIVLPAGTEVCIKAGTTVVYVTADGIQTLHQLVGVEQGVSHYTVISTTTTTTSPTTTTVPPTTTTVPETTTTIPVTTTTDPVTTTTDPETTTTDPGTTVPTTVPTELPRTGANASALIVMGLVLLMSGGLLLLGVKSRA